MGKNERMSLGGYEIIEELGRGGMSVVYKARQSSLNRTVALKVLPRRLADEPEFVNRFEREATSIAALNHPNIIQIYDKGQDHKVYFFVMEFVDGHDLSRDLSFGPLPLTKTLSISRQICQALAYAHSRGIVHRDIKPQNILIDSNGFAKIADFGIAQLSSPESVGTALTQQGSAIGTFDYMAPEQKIDASRVDKRADLYAFGVVLYQMLTGQLPHPSHPVPSQRNPRTPKAMDQIVSKLLQENVELRYPSAEGVLRDLETALKPRPKAFKPQANRNHVGMGIAGIVLLLFLGSLWLLSSRVERDRSYGTDKAMPSSNQDVGLSLEISSSMDIPSSSPEIQNVEENTKSSSALDQGTKQVLKETPSTTPTPHRVASRSDASVGRPSILVKEASSDQADASGRPSSEREISPALKNALDNLNRGRTMLRNQIYRDADAIFHALAADSTLPRKLRATAFLWKAKTKEAEGNHAGAVKDYLDLSALYRDERAVVAEAQYLAGHLQAFKLNRQDVAIRNFLNVIQEYHDSDFADDALYSLGLLHLQNISGSLVASSKNRESMQDAYTQFARILERYPDSEWADDALFHMGQIKESRFNKAHDEAIALYQRIIDEYPQSPYPAYFLQATIVSDVLKDDKRALVLYEACIGRPEEVDKHVEAGKKKLRIEKALAKQTGKG